MTNLIDYYSLNDTDKILNETLYGLTVKNLTKYLSIYGMFELKEGPYFSVYNNHTSSIYDWK